MFFRSSRPCKEVLVNSAGANGDLHGYGRGGAIFSNIKLIFEFFLPLGTRLEARVGLVI